jgi:hypothetical protein
LSIAAATPPNADGGVTLHGTLTLMPAVHSRPDGSICWSFMHCWHDAERQQSVCEEMTVCIGLAVLEQ